ncbi:MAG: RusA family crossover junction endodeoxyribonuclease [Alphaproteobacteria bacterium]
MVAFTILGECASKANSRQLVTIGGRPRFIKSAKARGYVEGVKRQIRGLDPMLTGPLVVHITIYYATERPDLDEALILDALQGLIYKNDRQIREKHIYRELDRNNPRADVRVEPMEKMLALERMACGRAA